MGGDICYLIIMSKNVEYYEFLSVLPRVVGPAVEGVYRTAMEGLMFNKENFLREADELLEQLDKVL